MIKNKIFISLFFINTSLHAEIEFNILWPQMQSVYKNLKEKFNSNEFEQYSTPFWKQIQEDIGQTIKGSPRNILNKLSISSTMIRQIYDSQEKAFNFYINNFINEENKKKLSLFKLNNNESLQKIPNLKMSVNTLIHIYYALRILENHKHPINILFELGGGYGNFARIFKQLNDSTKIIIFDFPEILSIQYLFLSTTMPNTKIFVKDSIKEETFSEDGIYLLPVYLLEQINIKPDVFVSTFALTEAPESVQNIIFKKKFFEANLIYITGQIINEIEKDEVCVTNPNNIINKARLYYKYLNYMPLNSDNITFELIANTINLE